MADDKVLVSILKGLASAYAELGTYDENSIYICTDTGKCYLGEQELSLTRAEINALISEATGEGFIPVVSGATEGNIPALTSTGTLVDSGYSVNNGTGYVWDTPDSTILVTETVLSGVVASVVAGDLSDVLDHKMDIVDTGKTGELLIAKEDGNSEASGYTISSGSDIPASGDASATALVTESEVRATVDAVKSELESEISDTGLYWGEF